MSTTEFDEGFSEYNEYGGDDDWTSISSSDRKTFEKYQDSGISLFPIDEREQERLDCQHHLFGLSNLDLSGQKLFNAPIPTSKTLHRVLDVGTGTAIWACDFADEHPESVVMAVDINFVNLVWAPPNLHILIDDMEKEWDFPMPFDFIHCHMDITTLIPEGRCFEKALQHLLPGGYLEFTFIRFRLKWNSAPTTFIAEWSRHMEEAIAKAGYGEEDASLEMRHAGFDNVVEQVFEWPINYASRDRDKGKTGKIIAFFGKECMYMDGALRGMSLALLADVLELDANYVEILLALVLTELKCKNNRAVWQVYVMTNSELQTFFGRLSQLLLSESRRSQDE